MADLLFSIRRAEVSDVDQLATNNIEMARESESVDLDRETICRGVRELLDSPAKGRYYVLKVQEKVAGQLMITYEWSDWCLCWSQLCWSC